MAYKLTDSDGYTRRGKEGETLWKVGAVVEPQGEGSAPCGPGVLHAYISPEVAIFCNPVHAEIKHPRCFEVELAAGGTWSTDGLKRWTMSSLRVVREVALPELALEMLVAWAIVMAPHKSTRAWAVNWLNGTSCSAEAAWSAARSARSAAEAARSARSAEAAARSARSAAEAAEAARSARSAAWSAEAAARAAWSAAESAEAARSARSAWSAARSAESAGSAARSAEAAEGHLMTYLDRARAILGGTFPAERYDEPIARREEGETDGERG